MTRGDVYMLDFGVPFGSEPGMKRPAVIIQSDKDNLNGLNTKIVIPLTSNTVNAELKGNVIVTNSIVYSIKLAFKIFILFLKYKIFYLSQKFDICTNILIRCYFFLFAARRAVHITFA